MITIESIASMSLRSVSRLRWIIGVALAVLLAGCSVLRIGYGQAPTFVYWWIDGYVDLNEAQSPRLREAIDQWFDWHRRTELPVYLTLLARAQREVMEPATAQGMCAWRDEGQRRLDAALERAAPGLGTLMLSLGPEQLAKIERKLAKNGAELRKDYAQADRSERAKASLERTAERFEKLYGRLDEAQRARLAQLLAASPFDAERWLAERERRNRDLMQTLAGITAASRGQQPGVAQGQAQAAVQLLGQRLVRSVRPDYRAYQEHLTQDTCALAATMHNLTTPAQRQHAHDKLKGWEDDLRLLASAAAPGNGGASR
jgi:hypothetical protein